MPFQSTLAQTTSDSTLSFGDPLQALLTINAQFQPAETLENQKREINFMGYELQAICQGQTIATSLDHLNKFFFQTKGFRLLTKPVLLNDILSERGGCSLGVTLLYLHLANTLNLRAQLLHWPRHGLLRIEQETGCCFLDLEQNGKKLDGDEVLNMINKNTEALKTLSLTEILVQYLTYLAFHFRQIEDMDGLHKTLSLILKIEPENTRYLAERAMLRKKIGLLKESLSDFKRYFAFTDRQAAPEEVNLAYDELRI